MNKYAWSISLFLILNIFGSDETHKWFWDINKGDPQWFVNGIEQPNDFTDPTKWPEKLISCAIDGYKLTKFISAGAQGRVFQAQKGNKLAAIKFFKKEKDAIDEISALEAFEKLNPRSQTLVHKISGTPTKCCGGINCVVLEWVNGETLSDIMQKHGLRTAASNLVKHPEKLKPIDVKLVKYWIFYGLVGHRDMEHAGISNADQNLRNILWDAKNKKIKFIDFGFSTKSKSWSRGTFNFIDVHNLERENDVPQYWPYLGLFLSDEKDRKNFWSFLKKICNSQTAQHALNIATQENGYLYAFKDYIPPYNPPVPDNSTHTVPENNTELLLSIPSIIVIAIFAFMGLLIGGFVCYKKYYKKKNDKELPVKKCDKSEINVITTEDIIRKEGEK